MDALCLFDPSGIGRRRPSAPADAVLPHWSATVWDNALRRLLKRGSGGGSAKARPAPGPERLRQPSRSRPTALAFARDGFQTSRQRPLSARAGGAFVIVTPQDPRLRPLRGILLVALAVFLFALADAVTKQLTMQFPVPLVVAVRYFVSLVLVIVLLGPGAGAGLWRIRRGGLVLARGLCLALASLTMGLALRTLPVGETVSIIYLAPFAVLLLAGPVLGERVTLVAWIGAAVSLAGVLAIMRPGGGLDPVGVAFALGNAALATVFHLLTRILSRTETTAALMFHTMLTGWLVFLPFAALDLAEAAPAMADYLWMGVLGLLATGGHFLFAAAYRWADATTLAPINYLHLVWAAILGWLIFGHIPDPIALAGMAAIVAAGLCVTLLSRSAAPAPQIE
jgi:drug/metabolite transporter (DMT)-like permease